MIGGVTPAQTRILLAVIRVHRRDGRVTVRAVAAEAGLCGVGAVYVTLVRLRHLGLVAWEDHTNGTMRPLVKPVAIAA